MGISDCISEILTIIRQTKDPGLGYSKLLDLCSRSEESPLWKKLPTVNVSRDVADSVLWLEKELGQKRRASATGIYLGLDTLNMSGDDGHNVEIGGSDGADPTSESLDWAYGCGWYGDHYLIRGLREMHSVYAQPEEKDLFAFADYILFLGYSGLVLASAVENMNPEIRSGPKGRLFGWGFHDGDLFPLCRAIGERVERLATDE